MGPVATRLTLLPKSTVKMGAPLGVAVTLSPSHCTCEDNVTVERALGNPYLWGGMGWGFRSVIVATRVALCCNRSYTERHFLPAGEHNPLEQRDSNVVPNSASGHSCDGREHLGWVFWRASVVLCYSLPPLSLSSACRCLNTLGCRFV